MATLNKKVDVLREPMFHRVSKLSADQIGL